MSHEHELIHFRKTVGYAEVAVRCRDGRRAWAGNLNEVADPGAYIPAGFRDVNPDARDYDFFRWLAGQILAGQRETPERARALLADLQKDFGARYHEALGAIDETRETNAVLAMRSALAEAEAGLEFSVAQSCLCTPGGGFTCAPHLALSAVRVAIAIAKAEGKQMKPAPLTPDERIDTRVRPPR